jgi:hypothetical protein
MPQAFWGIEWGTNLRAGGFPVKHSKKGHLQPVMIFL